MKACVLYHIIFCFFYFNAFDEEIFYLSRNFIFYCWNCSYVRNWTKKKKKKKKIESKQKFISFAKYSLLPYVHVFYRDFQTSKIHKHPQFNYATRTSSQLFFFSNIYLSILSLITKERKKLANSPSNIPRFRFAIDRSSRRSWSPLRLENLESEPRFTSTREETRGEKAGTLRGYRYNCHNGRRSKDGEGGGCTTELPFSSKNAMAESRIGHAVRFLPHFSEFHCPAHRPGNNAASSTIREGFSTLRAPYLWLKYLLPLEDWPAISSDGFSISSL